MMMQKTKIYIPCVVAAALLFAGNFLPKSSSQPIAAYPHVQAIGPDDPGGLLIIDKKWIFPTNAGFGRSDAGQTVDDVLAIYGQ